MIRSPYLVYAFTMLLSFISAVVPVRAAEIKLPSMGDSTGSIISPEQERLIGEGVMRQVRRSLNIIADPQLTEYIQSVGYQIVSNSDNNYQDFTFFLIDDRSINAFAAPGGFIGINSGLLISSDSESEMASVVAHEVAHITQRHLARAYEAQTQLQTPSLIGLLAAVLLSTQNSELGAAALAATQAASIQTALNFTRSNEQEADDIGMQTLARAGFDPYAMPTFFEKLQNSARFFGRPPEFLSTHPVTITRIAESRTRAERYDYKQIPSSLNFLLAREKLIVLSEKDLPKLIKSYRKSIRTGQYRNQTAARYGYALALVKNDHNKRATQQINWLLKNHPDELAFLILEAQNDIAANIVSQGLQRYKKILKLFPGNHPTTIYYSQALLQQGQAKQARLLLQEHFRYRSPDGDMYRLKAAVEGAAGFPLEAHQSQAEYYYQNGDLPSAIQQLEIALRLKSENFYELSKIEARKNTLQQELAQRRKNNS